MFIVGLIQPGYAGETIKIESKIKSIGLFKNGLAVVKRTISIPKAGKYLLKDVPEPVHGTFWIESEIKVKTKITKKEFYVNEVKSLISLEETFADRNVTIHLKGENPTTLKGKVLKDKTHLKKNQWERTYRQDEYYYPQTQINNRSQNIYKSNPPYIRLKTKSSIIYLDSSLIAFIESDSINDKVKITRPVLILDVENVPKKGATVNISYLTKGISWAPSYKIDLEGEKNLKIEQKAVIKNELVDLKETDIKLISGFPNIKFAHVTSPFSLQTNWNNFFQQLNRRLQPMHASTSNVMTQQAVRYSESPQADAGLDLSRNEVEGVDIHYEGIGNINMNEGDSLALSVDRKKAGYERIVEWIIPDTRDQWGRYIEDYQRRQNPGKYQDAAWDSIRFKNPFKFPMTTAAAAIYNEGKFLGQTLSFWVNPNSETVLHITKALSLTTRNTEKEIKGEREKLYIAGRRFQKTKVEGQIYTKNHRGKTVKLLVRRKFSGELISAEGNPRCELLEIGVYSVNERNQLAWEFELGPGKEKTLKYTYSVLAYY